MSDYISGQIWLKVFEFLPVKTLLRCAAVCKTWRTIITSSAFISGHLSAARRRPFLLSRTPNTPDPRAFSVHSNLEDPFPLSRHLRCPFPSDNPAVSFRLVGSVDGLLCLSDDLIFYSYTVIVWNPSIRRSVHLPKPAFNSDSIGPYHFALGFGFDSSIDDYKVVRVVYAQGWTREEKHRLPPLVEVCSLKELSWRPVSVPENMEYVISELMWSQCFIHGAVHWVASKGPENVILLFDLAREVFKKMKLPGPVAGLSHLRLYVSVVGGMLAVLDLEPEPFDPNMPFSLEGPRVPSNINVWVKKGYGKGGAWTKIYRVEHKWQVGLALQLGRIGGEVSMESGGDESGKPETGNEFKDLHLPTCYNLVCFDTNPFFAFSLPESLVLLDKANGENAYQVSEDEEWMKSDPEGENGAYRVDPENEKNIKIRLLTLTMFTVMKNKDLRSGHPQV